MESFFDFLPGIIAFLIILGKIIKKISKLANKEFPINQPAQSNTQGSDYNNESINKKEEQKSIETEPITSSTAEERKRTKQRRDIKKEPNKKIKDKIKASENEIFNSKKISRKQIVQGIIYKEIIDKPRSKRLHQFFSKKID